MTLEKIFSWDISHTDCLIIYYDCDTERVKIISHYTFDEGFNDLSTESVPLGFQQLVHANPDEAIPSDNVDISSSDLDFFVYPFTNKQIVDVPVLPNNKDFHFGLELCNDNLYDRVYIEKNQEQVYCW